jgi:hypothetical protein
MSKAKTQNQPETKRAAARSAATAEARIASPQAALPIVTAAETPKQDLAKDFKIAHYTASVQAWFGTKMEKDKSLLTLASAGIGILVSLGANSRLEKIFFVTTILFFVITVFCSLVVFEINAKLIENIIREKSAKSTGKIASIIDYTLMLSFLLGVIAFSMLGVARFMNW